MLEARYARAQPVIIISSFTATSVGSVRSIEGEGKYETEGVQDSCDATQRDILGKMDQDM